MKIQTLAQQLLFNTLRIEAYGADGKLVGVGTGFILAHDWPELGREHFLITNKHVVEGAERVALYVHQRELDGPRIGDPFFLTIDQFQSGCFGHPLEDVDIVITPVSWWFDHLRRGGVEPYFTELTTDILVTPEQAADLDVVEPVLFVGYPNGLFDQRNFTPLFRRGITASPYQLDYGGRPVFIIDASVFGGSSGSPVFRGIPSMNGRALAEIQLLGVIAEVFFRTENGQIELRPAPTGTVAVPVSREMLDLGVVFKAHLIREVMDAWYEAQKDRLPEILAFRSGIRGEAS